MMFNILSFNSKFTGILISSTLATLVLPSLIQPEMANANPPTSNLANHNFYVDADHVKFTRFEDYYFSGNNEFESADSSELDEFESFDILGIIEGIGNVIPKLFGFGGNQPPPPENKNPAPDPFGLLASLGHQLIDCVPGVVFVTGLIPEAICVAPNFHLPPGQYVYNPFMNQIQPAVVNNPMNAYNSYNPYNPYNANNGNPYYQPTNGQVNYQSHTNVSGYNSQQSNVQVNHQSNSNFWNDGVFENSTENDDFFNF
jgi:hypothetical protein